METIADRIKTIRGRETQVNFSKILQMPLTTFTRYERGENEPDLDFIKKLSSKFGVSMNWLIDGEGEVYKSQINNMMKNCEQFTPTDFSIVAKVNARLSAGNGSLDNQSDILGYYAFRNNWILSKGHPNNMVLMDVSGDSMEPDIVNGDSVLIDQSKKEIFASKIYAVGFEDTIYVKRIEREPNKIILKSSNKEYPPIEFSINEYTEEQFRIIGRVLWVGREYN